VRRIIVVLLGFALFGAMFAAAYYQPRDVERQLPTPRFRLGPGEMQPDFIEPGAVGENVSVNITVVQGGPIDVYMMNMENLTLNALNGSTYTFELNENVSYNKTLSRTNITDTYNFTARTDGENQTVLLIGSRMPPDPDRPPEENVTAVSVHMTYTETEQRSLVIGALLASPSAALIVYVTYRHARRRLASEPRPHPASRGTEEP
jgi:uncharacterized membrane protein